MTKTPKQQAREMADTLAKYFASLKMSGLQMATSDTFTDEIERILNLEQLIEDSLRLKGLRELMGYVQNGSDATVTLFQDDATSTYFVQAGKLSEFDDSFNGAIDKAISTAMKEGE